MTEKETIDIKALVQNNPLTKLTSDYGSKIIQKIRERFSPEQQQLYVANLYCYLNYNSKTDFVVNLDRTWKWLGYNRINDCSRVLLKNFKENVDYKIEKAALQDGKAGPNLLEEGKNLGGAGLNRECITLTVNCFKKLCLKSRTEKADQIHDYFIGLEEMMNELVMEQTEELQQKLLLKDKQLKEKDQLSKQQINDNTINNYKKTEVVYMGYAEENKVLKVGYSKDIEERLAAHRREIRSDFTILYIFKTIYYRRLEDAIMGDTFLNNYRVQKAYLDGEIKKELFEVSDKFTAKMFYEYVLKLKKEIEKEDILVKENADLKLKLAKYEIQEKNSIINKFTEPIQLSKQIKANQDRIQLYDTNLKLIKTYETIQESCNESNLYKDAVPQSIHRSIKNNTLYKGYRFWNINRTQPVEEYEIPETYELSKEQTHQRVVQYKDKKLIGVYSCTKDASENLYKMIQNKQFVPKNDKLQRSTVSQINKSVTNALSVHTNHSGYEHYWYRESDIPEDLLKEYENYKLNNTLPKIAIHKNNKQVYKFDDNDNLVKSYNSITEARKTENLTEKTICKYITEKTLHGGHYFSFVG